MKALHAFVVIAPPFYVIPLWRPISRTVFRQALVMFRYSVALAFFVFAVCGVLVACSGGREVNPPRAVQEAPRSLLTIATPAPRISPTALNFGYVAIGVTSSPKPIVLSNNGSATLKISSITATCNTSFCFAQTSTCGTQVYAGKNCTIEVTFTPHKAGSASGTLSVFDNASGSPQTASLSGATPLACLPYGYPCSPLYNRCCPGLKCIFHPGSVRVGYSCSFSYAVREEYLERAISQKGKWLHVTDLPKPNAVTVIATATQTLLKTISVPQGASSVAITPSGGKVYVANTTDDSLSVIDTNRNAVLKTVSVGFGGHPNDVAVAKNGLDAYVVDAQKHTISVVDTSTDAVTRTIRASALPANIAVMARCAPGVVASHDGRFAYVVSAPANETAVTDLDDELAIALGAGS